VRSRHVVLRPRYGVYTPGTELQPGTRAWQLTPAAAQIVTVAQSPTTTQSELYGSSDECMVYTRIIVTIALVAGLVKRWVSCPASGW
jgi:hypothetical protein